MVGCAGTGCFLEFVDDCLFDNFGESVSFLPSTKGFNFSFHSFNETFSKESMLCYFDLLLIS